MAEDVVAILDGHARNRAHIVGMSLGGFIAQIVALEYRDRVASLTLFASEPLGWDGPPLPGIAPAFLDHFGLLAGLDWTDQSAVCEFLVGSARLCAGPAVPFDADSARRHADRVLSRTSSPASMFNHAGLRLRQDWTGRFREITLLVRVIRGDADPILPAENGCALAAGIAGASLLVLPGVGHELPPAAVAAIVDAVSGYLAGPAPS
jgi:pimeloyl-ACP methyl ester carboxylesterase